MAKVSELKERARAFEKDGEHGKALQIYQHVLQHLEGTPALARELPMYVKAGDLQLKLEDKAGAIASYEKAAEQYATHGSAKSVIALAGKVLRVDPMRADFHLVQTRALIDHGHIAAARDVLADYAGRSGLERTQEALGALEGREDEGAKPLLEMILDSAERGERSSTEEAAKRVSVQLGGLVTLDDFPAQESEEPDEDELDAEQPDEEEPDPEAPDEESAPKTVFDPGSMLETVEQASTIEAPALDLEDGLTDPGGKIVFDHTTPPPLDHGPMPPVPIPPPEPLEQTPEPEPIQPAPVPEPLVPSQSAPGEGTLTMEPDGSAFSAQPEPQPKPQPPRPRARPPSGVLRQRPERKGIPMWVWGAAGVVVIGGGVGFVMMRGGGETAPPPVIEDTVVTQPVATFDTSALGLAVDSGIFDPNDSMNLGLGDSLDSLAAGDSAALDSVNALADSLATDSAAGPQVVAPAPATAGPAYIVDGSTVQDVVQYSRQGRSGWRTIQTLAAGEEITVETTLANLNDPSELAAGATNVTSDANGAVGKTRIDNLIVTVTGAVSETQMLDLLTSLVEHTP